ncbi:MAG TPA: DUF1223 domain-containing protein [Candidatus Acidoferrales bacterium]|nr:DUF1223 domain-containing protein [Candidatus Acidoferrales bacterium]
MTRPGPRSLLACLALVSAAMISPSGSGGSPAPAHVPVLVELFTSEGCSDCPPADRLLAELDHTQPVAGALIIPLEEHVDYWDHQGWRDPFSSAAFTERQEAYARHFGIAGPYTPQMVVAGRTEFVGSASHTARVAIAAAAQTPGIEVGLDVMSGAPRDDSLHAAIRAAALPADAGEGAEVYLAITEDALVSDVRAGENAGRRMEHRAVVRKFDSAGTMEPGTPFTGKMDSRIAPGWKRENLRVVALLEGVKSGKIFGAATASVGR